MPAETLFGVQKIFFRHHKGPGITDVDRTFCSRMVAEIDKRNAKSPSKKLRLNPKLRRMETWTSIYDPSPGDYTYHCDPTGYPQILMRKNLVDSFRLVMEWSWI
ncbi:hypothetical protein Tco_0676577 [Tanacetum coccineum]